MINRDFWRKKKVFITGHTGFKGSWLCVWLKKMGAVVHGYSLNAPTKPSLYEDANIENTLDSSTIADIRDYKKLLNCIQNAGPDIVIHLAARALVGESYSNPRETYETNVMGTVNFLEAVRQTESVSVAINVTTDKVYKNREWCWGYRENDELGGDDPYSSSKACSELISHAYRYSFAIRENERDSRLSILTARAGNVIGGGDWAEGRLIPDCIRSYINKEAVKIRHPEAVRPWQHVLDALGGYILLAEKSYHVDQVIGGEYNFGPEEQSSKPVGWLVNSLFQRLGNPAPFELSTQDSQMREHSYLKLDSSRAKRDLGWIPRWSLEKTIDRISAWILSYVRGDDVLRMMQDRITEYEQM